MRSRCCFSLAATCLRSRNPFLRSISGAAGPSTGKEGFSGDHGLHPQSSISSSSVASAAADRRRGGLSLEAAVAGVKHRNANSKSKTRMASHDPESVVELFLSRGFTRSQVERVVAMYPKILSCHAKKTLKPKMDFLSGELGFSDSDIANIVTSNSSILRSSSEKRIRSTFALLSSILRSKEHIITVLKSTSMLISCSTEKCILPKLERLRGLAVSDRAISRLTRVSPRVLTLRSQRFDQVIVRLGEFGFSPTASAYVLGIHAVSALKSASLNRRLALYRSYGLSEDELLFVFRKHPLIVLSSDQNIRNHMDFILNNLRWKPQAILSIPALMGLSLERRLIPRSAVRSALLSKGFLNSSKANSSILHIREDLFLERYVTRFQNACPGLLDTYQKAKEMALTNRS